MHSLRNWDYLLKGTKKPVLVFTNHANLRYYCDPRKIGPWVAGYVKAPRSLDSMTCTKLNLRGKYWTSRESLLLLEMTQSLLVREEVTLGSFQECWIGNQVKLKAWLLKYWSFIYRQGHAQAMKLKVGRTGQELSIRKVRSGTQTCCGLYESHNRKLA